MFFLLYEIENSYDNVAKRNVNDEISSLKKGDLLGATF